MNIENNNKRFNKGTTFGKDVIEKSLLNLGCGRSILVDRNDVIIAGHDVYETAMRQGKKIRVVETDGDELVVVKRRDVDAYDRKGLELAFVDNLCSELNLSWNRKVLLEQMNACWGFNPKEWNEDMYLDKPVNIDDFFLALSHTPDTPVAQPSDNAERNYSQLDLFDF